MQVQLSKKASKQLQKLGLKKHFEKQKALFLNNPFHPSLDFIPLKGQNKGFYAFRMIDQYRARLIKLDEQTYFILVVGTFISPLAPKTHQLLKNANDDFLREVCETRRPRWSFRPAHPLTDGSVWVSSPLPSSLSSTYSQYW